MKKSLILIALLLGLSLGASRASALTVTSISPTQVTKSIGSTFDVSIVLTPDANAPDYSAKIGLTYNPDILEVTHFKYGDNMIQLSQPGYDVVDNTKGVFVKTAGFPGGINRQTLFGTVTFRVKAAGTGVVALSSDGMVLDNNNKNTYTRNTVGGITSITVPGATLSTTANANPRVLGASTVVTKKIVTKKTSGTTVAKKIIPSPASTITYNTTASDTALTDTVTPTPTDSSLTTNSGLATTGSVLGASVANTGSSSWLGIGIGLIVLLIVIGVIYSIAREV